MLFITLTFNGLFNVKSMSCNDEKKCKKIMISSIAIDSFWAVKGSRKYLRF